MFVMIYTDFMAQDPSREADGHSTSQKNFCSKDLEGALLYLQNHII